MGFASPPYDGFALLASAHGCAWLQAHSPNACYECTIHCLLAPRNTPWRLSLCIWTMPCVLDLAEKRKQPEHPYRVADRSYTNFRESPECELRRIP
jgi:hypothetical protein